MLFRQIFRWLRAGGVLLISIEDDDRADIVAQWLDVPMYFSHFDASTTKRLISDAGFTVEQAVVELQLEGSDEIPYLFLIAHKAS